MGNIYFCIAEQIMQLSIPSEGQWKTMLPSFVAFECPCPPDGKVMCSLEVVTDEITVNLSTAIFLTDIDRMLGERVRLYESDDLYIIDLEMEKGGRNYRMISNRFFTKGYAYIGRGFDRYSGEVLNAFLMMLFAQSSVLRHTCLMHASVVMKGDLGYAFLGKSGTGKSTHSALWLKCFGDAELLNDDNPAIRMTGEGKVYVYGTPWSGKTPCYRNKKVELAAWVRLEQAPVNSFVWKSGVEAFTTLLPSCSGMRWNDCLYTALCDLLEDCVQQALVGYLKCRPDEEAAFLCYNEIIKKER